MYSILWVALIGLVVFFQRFITTIGHPLVHDTYGHLLFVKYVGEQRSGPFGTITARVPEARPYRAPFLLHWILSGLPFDFLMRFNAVVNPSIDAVAVAGFSWLMLVSGFPIETVLFTVGLYLFTPLMFSSVSIGPRVSNFTPRLSSEVALMAFFLVYFLLPTSWLPLGVMSVLAFYVLSSSKFGTQALLLLVVGFTLANQSLGLIVPTCIGIALAALASKGMFLTTLKAHIAFLVDYFKRNLRGEMYVSNRNSFSEFKKLSAIPSLKRKAIQFAYLVVGRNSWTGILLKAPLMFVTLIVLAWTGKPFIGPDQFTQNAFYLLCAAGALFILISFRPFLFLGEAERYISHVGWLIAAYCSATLLHAGLTWVIWLLLAYGAVFYVGELILMKWFRPFELVSNSDQQLIVDFLQQEDQERRVVCFPFDAIPPYRLLMETKHQVVFPIFSAPEWQERFQVWRKGQNLDLDKLDTFATEMGVDTLIVSKRHLPGTFDDWTPNPEVWHKSKVETDKYVVVER